MQKFRCLWWYGVMGVFTGIAMFCMSGMRVLAEETAGGEGYFTHIHSDACYKEVTGTCENKHICAKGYEEYQTFHCTTCGTMVNHKIVSDSWYCPVKNQYWQINAIVSCTVCGRVYNTWSNYYPSLHVVTDKKMICDMTEEEQTTGISIVADTSPTNTGVTLKVCQNVIKEDAQNGTISFDWGADTLFVTENGTYSVTATNSAGQSVTTSVTISCIDKISPVIHSITHDSSSVTQNSVTVSVSATDAESGLAESAYSTDGGITWSTQSTFTVSEGVDVQLIVRDKAGNETAQVVQRSAFPYPPKPTPAPTPVPPPTPVSTPVPQQQPATQTGSVTGTVTDGEQNRNDIDAVPSGDQSNCDVSTTTSDVQNESDIGEKASGTDNVSRETATKTSKEDDKDSARETGANFTTEDGIELVEVEEEIPMVAKPLLEEPEGTGDYTGLEQSGEPDGETVGTQISKNSAFGAAGIGQGILSGINGSMGEREADAGSDADTGMGSIHHVSLQKILTVTGAVLTGLLAVIALIGAGRFIWQNSAVLYCYDGGDAYKRIGLFFLRKKEDGVELYLPEYLTETTDILRYRLLLKRGLVKKFAGSDLVVYSEDSELRRPLEECVDFVL